MRLLFLLRDAGEFPTNPPDPVGTVAVIRSEVRLHALDFWLRNPDYLADELLTEVEAGRLANEYVAVARQLLDDPEPQLRRYPMERWLYGAYDAIDDAVALLETAGLARVRRSGNPGYRPRTNLYLTSAGKEAADQIEQLAESLSWYRRQITVVLAVAGDNPGTTLKERQYRQAEYADTELGSRIAPIASRVRRRLEQLSAGGNA